LGNLGAQFGGQAIATQCAHLSLFILDQIGGATLAQALLDLFAAEVTDAGTDQRADRAARYAAEQDAEATAKDFSGAVVFRGADDLGSIGQGSDQGQGKQGDVYGAVLRKAM